MLSARHDSTESYQIYEDGQAVGRIILPRQVPTFRPTEGTVYLRRSPSRLEESRPRVA